MCPQISHIEFRILLGQTIRRLRKNKNWSQEALAENSGLSYKYIGEIERGTVNPSLDTLLSISNALRVEIVELFSSASFFVLTERDVSAAKQALNTLIKIMDSP